MRALIAETCPSTRALVAEALHRRGHLPTLVRDGRSALLAQERDVFPLLFLDRELPSLAGPELFRRMRALPGGEGSTLLAITDAAGIVDVAPLLEAGATDYLVKPVDPAWLETRVLIAERGVAEGANRIPVAAALHAIERTPDCVAIRRGERLVYVNPAFASSLGYASPEELLGRRVVDLLHPDDRALAGDRIRRFDEEGMPVPPLELRFARADGSVATLEIAPVQVIDFEGQLAALAVGRDVSERKRMQDELVRSDRMASIGRLAVGIAGEVEEPLAVLELRIAGLAGAELADALAATDRVRRLVEDLRTFSCADEAPRRPIDVRGPVDAAMRVAWREARTRAVLVKHFAAVPLVEASEARLGQLFLNLLLHVVRAMPDRKVHESEVRVHTATDPEGRAVVEIRDNGPGMSPEAARDMFVGKATPLPLTICLGIVTSLGGDVTARSAPGAGVAIRIRLPAARGG